MLSPSSIQSRLITAISAGVVLFIIISGIAISLPNQSINDYNQLIADSVAQERSINAMNFTFKVEV